MRSTLAKARWHLEQAEKWQQEVERLEAWGEREAQRRLPERKRRDGFDLPLAYMVKVVLSDHFEYGNAVGNRNGHQQQANMYMLAHLASINETNGDRGADGKMRMTEVVGP